MVCACALALTATAMPLLGDEPGSADPTARGPRVVHANRAADEDCDTASLRPTGFEESGAALERIRKRRKLVVGVDQNSYLWGYRDPASGELVGFDIALAKAIARDILDDEDAIIFKMVPTDQRESQIEARNVDMVVRTMSITCDRMDRVAFSTAYFEAGQQLLVPKSSGIREYDAGLAGKRVCTARKSTGEDKLRLDGHGARLVLVDNQLDCLVRLQLGEVDAVLTDNALGAGQAAQDPQVHLVGDRVTDEYYGIAMHRGDTDLVRRVNKVLEDYRAGGVDSEWMRSFDTWLGDHLERPPLPPEANYRD